MPEIVEAEKLVRQLRPAWVGRKIITLFGVPKEDDTYVQLLKNRPRGTLSKLTDDATITDVGRQGKQILIKFLTKSGDNYIWRIHLGHTGWWLPGNEEANKVCRRDPIADNFIHTLSPSTVRVMMLLDDKARYDFYDPRTFSRWYIHTPAEWVKVLKTEFGPDWINTPMAAAESVIKRFETLKSTGSRQTVKSVLLDQRVSAGLGNYLACEILHRAGVHPHLPIVDVTVGQAVNIVKQTPPFIAESFIQPGHEHWHVFKRLGEWCKTCRAECISRVKDASSERSSYFCPVCQKL